MAPRVRPTVRHGCLHTRTARITRPWAMTLALTLVGLGVVSPARPAAADPPAPTDYRSRVTAVEPRTPALDVEVVGGDGFLQVAVPRGVRVEVPGYSGEPYIQILADGTVQENDASAATVINQSRDRTATDQPFDAGAPPRWRTVATDGRWAWHDHRIHYMGGGVPPAARTAEGVTWEVPLTVDGRAVVVSGAYRLLDAPSPLPWVTLALVIVAGLLVVGRVSPLLVGGVALLVAGGLATVIGAAQRAVTPPGTSTSVLLVVLPVVAVVGGAVALVQRGRVLRAVAALAGTAALGGWALVRIAVLVKAELPTDLAPSLDRAGTALGLSVAVAAAVLVVRSGSLAARRVPPATAPASTDT